MKGCEECDFYDWLGDYCYREEKDQHFIRPCDKAGKKKRNLIYKLLSRRANKRMIN